MIEQIIIGIAGESGVGKSTIADIISFYFNKENTLVLSTDDLHKWERHHANWKIYTHLNPEANNIDLGDQHLLDLKSNRFIYRSVYNHKTGIFDPPKKILPKPVIIIEGLHAFYSDISKQNIELKIFIDTEDDLKNHWKIIRDTHERGYTYTDVLKSVEKRKNDTKLIKKNQINDADVIITIKSKNKINIIGNENENIEIELDIENKNNKFLNLFNFIKKFNSILNEYVNLCKTLGNDICLVQDKGGNFSIKINDDLLIIKSSGIKIKDTSNTTGFSVVKYNELKQKILNNKNNITESFLNNIYSNNLNKPSMEIGFHIIMDKVVLHTHPIYLNILLCLKNSEQLIKKLFFNFNYLYIPYKNPGSKLIIEILNKNPEEIIFLENHGLIITTYNSDKAKDLTLNINSISKEYIQSNLKEKYISFNDFIKNEIIKESCTEYSLPDSAIFLLNNSTSDLFYAQKYIDKIGKLLGEVRYLNQTSIIELNSLEAEKYRKIV